MSVQIHRRETKTSGGVQIKGNSGFVPGQLLYGSLVPYRASIVSQKRTLQTERSSGVIGCLERYPTVKRSSDRVYVGGFNSPAVQLTATVFIGSLTTAFVKLWPQFLHSNVRSSKPSGPGAIPSSIMRPSHFGHPGRRIGSRQGSGRVCSSGMMHSPVDQGGSALLLPPDAVDMR